MDQDNSINHLETPFVRFLNGMPLFLLNNIYESAATFLSKMEESTPEGSCQKLISHDVISCQHIVFPESAWFPLFKEFLKMPSRGCLKIEPFQFLPIKLLKLMLQDNIHNAWNDVKKIIIEHIDVFSGWDRCRKKDDPFIEGIFGSESQIYSEARLDFIGKEISYSFGAIKKKLDVFCLFAISKDFKANPEAYSPCISEPYLEITSFPWHSEFYHIRRTKWGIFCNFCAPDWLAEDLIACFKRDIMGNA